MVSTEINANTLRQVVANVCTNFFFFLILSEAVPVGVGLVAGGGGWGNRVCK